MDSLHLSTNLHGVVDNTGGMSTVPMTHEGDAELGGYVADVMVNEDMMVGRGRDESVHSADDRLQ